MGTGDFKFEMGVRASGFRRRGVSLFHSFGICRPVVLEVERERKTAIVS